MQRPGSLEKASDARKGVRKEKISSNDVDRLTVVIELMGGCTIGRLEGPA